MSSFFGSSDPTRWGGLLKQAISNVETTFDTLLEQQNNERMQQQQQPRQDQAKTSGSLSPQQQQDTETETYVDPISGMVTTVQRPKRKEHHATTPGAATPSSSPSSPSLGSSSLYEPKKPPERTGDLASRLAAAMNDKPRSPDLKSRKAASSTAISPPRSSTESRTSAAVDSDTPDIKTAAPSETPEDQGDATQIHTDEEEQNTATEVVEQAEATPDSGTTDADADADAEQNQKQQQQQQLEEEQEDDKPSEIVHKSAKPSDEKVAQEQQSKLEHGEAEAVAAAGTGAKDDSDAKPVPQEVVLEEPAKASGTDSAEQTTTSSKSVDIPQVETDTKDTILQQREAQLFQAMQNIAQLHDQIHSLQEQADKERKQYEDRIKEMVSRPSAGSGGGADAKTVKKLESTVEDLQKQLALKTEQVQGLMEEGEKLSKTELKHTTAIKRLRSEKQDQDRSISELQKRIEKTSSDLVEANAKLMKAAETDKRSQETIKMLSDMTERQTKHINKLETEAIAHKEDKGRLEAKLKEAKESLEAERDRIHAESKEAHAAILEKEVNTVKKLRQELQEAQKHSDEQEQRLRDQIRELQTALQTAQSQAGEQEDTLRKEITELQQRMRQLEAGSEDVDSTVAEATASLLQQIEALQTQHSIAIKNRDQSEQSVVLRLQNAESERDEAKGKLEDVNRQLTDAIARVDQIEHELADKKLEVEKQHAQYNAEQATYAKQTEELEQLRQTVDQHKAKEQELENTIKTRYQKLMKERLQEEKRQWEQKLAGSVRKPTKGVESEESSYDGSSPSESPFAKITASSSPVASPRSSTDTNSYSGLTTGSNHAISSNIMHANVRHLENQLSFYQTQLQSSTQSRDELSEEVLQLTVEMEKMRKENMKMQGLEKQLRELEERYHASLELLGERTEQVEELKQDIADLKEMYRNQIVELVQGR